MSLLAELGKAALHFVVHGHRFRDGHGVAATGGGVIGINSTYVRRATNDFRHGHSRTEACGAIVSSRQHARLADRRHRRSHPGKVLNPIVAAAGKETLI